MFHCGLHGRTMSSQSRWVVGGGAGGRFLLSYGTSGEGISFVFAWDHLPLRSRPLQPPHAPELLFLQLPLLPVHTHGPQEPTNLSAGRRGFPKKTRAERRRGGGGG